MNQCKTCRWWEDGECEMLNDCKPVTISITADDDSGLSVRVLTSPEFGCVLHEERRDQ